MRLRKDGRLVQCGKDISGTDIKIIIEIVETYTQLSYKELAKTVCENLNWFSASGALKYDACVKLLGKLQSIGLIELPLKRPIKRSITPKKPMLILPEFESPIQCGIRDLGSVHLILVTENEENRLWEAYVDRYHYLGYRKPFGCTARYFVESDRGKLGCLLFSGAAKSLLDRDRWIGWSYEERLRKLGFVANNSRYLVFPWVKVKNLASHVLGQVGKRIGDDWEQLWGYRPVLMETFVDPKLFSGSCYKAANWHYLGFTTGIGLAREGKSYTSSAKKIFVKPLVDDFRNVLIGESL
jgi:Domain of unknown function (DUF4338)